MPRWFVRAVIATFALVLMAAPTAAQPRQQPSGPRLEVDAGYGGSYLLGRRLPVRITIESNRLLRGALEVSVRDQPGTWTTPVEVPAGSDKAYVIVIPTPFSFEIREVRVRLVGGGAPVTTDAEVEPLTDEQLVGLLAEMTPADPPPALPLTMGAGTARFVAIGPDELAAEGALDPLGTIVAGPDELGRLDATTRAAVLDWVDRGGRLLVDAAPGAPIAGLPDAWQPGDDGRSAAGLGAVRATAGAAAAGRWADIIEPTPTASLAELQELGGISIVQMEPVGDSVARDAGLEALELPWLLAFLGIYVALAGPVAWFVLRRRRPALGWVVVPSLAVLFTGASFVVGSDLRSGTNASQGSVIETGAAGARATTVVGLVSRNGRDGESRFPTGWTAGSVDSSFFGGPFTGTPELSVRTDADGTEASVPLAAGGFGVVRAAGRADVDGRLVVDARSDGNAVVGTVRNELPFAVSEVGVLLGRATDQLGHIEPGESVEFRFEGGELQRNDPYMPPEAALWPRSAGYNAPPDFDSIVNLALWNEAHMGLGPNARARGIVTAVGWTRDYRPPVDVAGEGEASGRSAVVARAAVTGDDDGAVAPGAAHREIVRGPRSIELPDEDVRARTTGALWRFSLPEGSAGRVLELDVPAYVGRIDVWDGTSWRPLDDRLADFAPERFDGNIGALRQVAVPAELSSTGAVWVRGWLLADVGAFDGAGLDLHDPRAAS